MLVELGRSRKRSPDATETAGGSGTETATSTEPKKKSAAPYTATESEAQYQVQLQRFGGNHEMLARQLWGEQLTARRRNREIREERDALRTRNPEGSLVLHKQELADYRAWQKLGKPTELEARLAEADTLKTELAASKRKEVRSQAAKALGYNPLLLADRLDVSKLDVEMRDVTENGETKTLPFARKSEDDKALWEPLSAVAARDWKGYPLTVGASEAATAPNAAPNALSFPNNGAGGATAGSVVDRFLADREKRNAARPNPLGAKGTAQKSA